MEASSFSFRCTVWDNSLLMRSKGLFIFDLGRHGSKLLFFSLYSLGQLTLDAFQVRYSFLGQFKVSLNLALDLFNIRFCLLFAFKSIFTFIQRLFKLSFNLAQVVAFILAGLNVFFGFLARISNVSLFLSKLSNKLFLVYNFFLKGPNLAVFGSLIFFTSFHGGFKLLNFTT